MIHFINNQKDYKTIGLRSHFAGRNHSGEISNADRPTVHPNSELPGKYFELFRNDSTPIKKVK